jgi:hypothetical protein
MTNKHTNTYNTYPYTRTYKRKVQAPLPVYMDTVIYNEVKWGINSIIAALMHSSVFIAYLYHILISNQTVSLGNLQILNG